MATINYNGMELEILEPQIFDYPRTCVVWDIDYPSSNGFSVKQVLAVLPMSFRNDAGIKPVITNDKTQWNFCALLPEKPKPRRATWKELAYWLIDGKGLVLDENRGKIDTGVIFSKEDLDAEVSDYLKVMRRDDADWHEPDVKYMGITEVKTYEDVVKREG